MLFKIRLPHGLLMLLATACLSGCSQFQFDLQQPIPWFPAEEEGFKAGHKVTAFWTDTIHYESGKKPTRGFGGRLMFYGDDGKTPVKVDGTLAIYAFDEFGRSPTDSKPDRKFVIRPEHLQNHYSESELGHSYSIWIPWDEAGGEQKEISLIVRLTPNDGPVLVGEQTRHLLPGVAPDPAKLAAEEARKRAEEAAERVARAVSYEVISGNPVRQEIARNQRPERMQTTTIEIPPRFGIRTPQTIASRGPSRSEPRVARRAPVQTTPPAGSTWTAPPTTGYQQTAPAANRPGQWSQPRSVIPAVPDRLRSPMPSTGSHYPGYVPRGVSSTSARVPRRPLQADSSPSRFRLPAEPTARLAHGHAPWQPPQTGWQSHDQPTPSPGTMPGFE